MGGWGESADPGTSPLDPDASVWAGVQELARLTGPLRDAGVGLGTHTHTVSMSPAGVDTGHRDMEAGDPVRHAFVVRCVRAQKGKNKTESPTWGYLALPPFTSC